MNHVKYFLLNKEDFVREQGYFCSKLIDSGAKQTVWSRICVQCEEMEDRGIYVQIFASEQRDVSWKGNRWDIQQIIVNQGIQIEEKLTLFSRISKKTETVKNADCLIHHVTGRYLWLVIIDKSRLKRMSFSPEIQIFFQADSWISLLPEIYTKHLAQDDFLFRYLSIFQWIYYDMSQRISMMPHMLYPAFADIEVLEWLAGWFDMDNLTAWNKEQLVYLLENVGWLYSIRGTKLYMEKMVWLFTGYLPFIVEYYQTECYKTDIKKTKLLEELYGENAYIITIVLPEAAKSGRQEAAILRKIIRSSIPADIECRLVVLEPYIFLDRYTYVGINSQLGGYKDVSLDGNSLTPYITAIGNRLYGRADG